MDVVLDLLRVAARREPRRRRDRTKRCARPWRPAGSAAAAPGGRSRSAARPPGPARPAPSTTTSGRSRTGWSEDRALPQPAPDAGQAARPGAAAQLRLDAAAFGRRTCTCSTGSARDNPKDERLFALAEVRDMTPVPDEPAAAVAVPACSSGCCMQAIIAASDGSSADRPPERSGSHRTGSCSTSGRRGRSRASWHEPRARAGAGHRGARLERGRAAPGARRPTASVRAGSARRGRHNPGGRGGGRSAKPSATTIRSRPLDRLPPEGAQMPSGAGCVYPFEMMRMFARARGRGERTSPRATSCEHDLDDDGRLAPVARDHGPATPPTSSSASSRPTPTPIPRA